MLTLLWMNLHITEVDAETQKDLESCDNPLIGSMKRRSCSVCGSAGATPVYSGAGRALMSWELFASTMFSKIYKLGYLLPASQKTPLALILTTGFSGTLCIRASWGGWCQFHTEKNFFLHFSVFRMTEIVKHTETHTRPSVLGTHPAWKKSARIIKIWQSYK